MNSIYHHFIRKELLIVTGEIAGNYPKDLAVLLKDYGGHAVQCCINAWNQLCPQCPLTNTTEVVNRKRWLFSGPDAVTLEQSADCGQISKIVLGINRRLTAKALRRGGDLPLIVVDCWIYWNCGTEQVRGWRPSCIVVDVAKGCVVRFPDIVPATPHVHFCPLP